MTACRNSSCSFTASRVPRQRWPKLRADGAKAVRFTEVDVRAGSSARTDDGRRHKSLDSAERLKDYDGVVLAAPAAGEAAGGTRRAARRARTRGADRRVREHGVRGARRRQHDAARARRSTRRHHRDGAARRRRSRGAGARDGEACGQGRGVGSARAEPRASHAPVTITTITATPRSSRPSRASADQKGPERCSGLCRVSRQSTNSTVTGFVIKPGFDAALRGTGGRPGGRDRRSRASSR